MGKRGGGQRGNGWGEEEEISYFGLYLGLLFGKILDPLLSDSRPYSCLSAVFIVLFERRAFLRHLSNISLFQR